MGFNETLSSLSDGIQFSVALHMLTLLFNATREHVLMASIYFVILALLIRFQINPKINNTNIIVKTKKYSYYYVWNILFGARIVYFENVFNNNYLLNIYVLLFLPVVMSVVILSFALPYYT